MITPEHLALEGAMHFHRIVILPRLASLILDIRGLSLEQASNEIRRLMESEEYSTFKHPTDVTSNSFKVRYRGIAARATIREDSCHCHLTVERE